MLNICMSSKSTQAYSWRKYLLGVIRGTDPSLAQEVPRHNAQDGKSHLGSTGSLAQVHAVSKLPEAG